MVNKADENFEEIVERIKFNEEERKKRINKEMYEMLRKVRITPLAPIPMRRKINKNSFYRRKRWEEKSRKKKIR